MDETNKRQDLMATLRDALRTLEGTLGRTREGVDEIVSQAARLREGVDALGNSSRGSPRLWSGSKCS